MIQVLDLSLNKIRLGCNKTQNNINLWHVRFGKYSIWFANLLLLSIVAIHNRFVVVLTCNHVYMLLASMFCDGWLFLIFFSCSSYLWHCSCTYCNPFFGSVSTDFRFIHLYRHKWIIVWILNLYQDKHVNKLERLTFFTAKPLICAKAVVDCKESLVL